MCVVISDNISSLTSSVDKLNIRHLQCFAHTFNLVVKDALKSGEEIYIIGASTFLDLRFKSFTFEGKDAIRKIEERQVVRMSAMGGGEEEVVTHRADRTEEPQPKSTWACFDNKVHDYMRQEPPHDHMELVLIFRCGDTTRKTPSE
ncbi:hypothetical protein PoB_006363300 [Plakobranchus ocellatus]|uniref:DUF659 domain-containing protein n=1 Tax=Plakobranchus ocellatus TaxID=259542 RepID=A0AAV4CZ01_9GAST|nr:hypothetical protein PoB_006363300 [Plakobranchus ocellatus]